MSHDNWDRNTAFGAWSLSESTLNKFTYVGYKCVNIFGKQNLALAASFERILTTIADLDDPQIKFNGSLVPVGQNCSFEDFDPHIRREAKFRCPDLHSHLTEEYNKLKEEKRHFEDYMSRSSGYIPMRKGRQFMATLFTGLANTVKVVQKVRLPLVGHKILLKMRLGN